MCCVGTPMISIRPLILQHYSTSFLKKLEREKEEKRREREEENRYI
jgi:hypothetical protein